MGENEEYMRGYSRWIVLAVVSIAVGVTLNGIRYGVVFFLAAAISAAISRRERKETRTP